MGKITKIAKILRRKAYWERERNKCFYGAFYFPFILVSFSFKAKYYPGIKYVNKIGWANADAWNKFNYFFDWFLIIILFAYLFLATYCLVGIQKCSRKLVDINQELLNELNNLEL